MLNADDILKMQKAAIDLVGDRGWKDLPKYIRVEWLRRRLQDPSFALKKYVHRTCLCVVACAFFLNH